MRRLSDATRERVNTDSFYRTCVICKSPQVQIHHNLIHGRRQVDDWWALLPLCVTHHNQANQVEMRQKLNWIMCNRAPVEDLIKYSKVTDLVAMKRRLNRIYGNGGND